MEDIKKMLFRDGFAEVLLRRYADAAASGQPQSQRQIFEEMETEYEAMYQYPCFWTFDAFRMWKSRHPSAPSP